MRMMKTNKNETIMVIGIDHGYGNMKTATRCFPSGVARYEKEPIFQNTLLVYNGMYYQIGEEHKEFCAEKTQDGDYYVLTLAAIARELEGKGMNSAKVHIAAGLPLTWGAMQKEDFQKYLLQNERVDFTFRNKQYHVEFEGADIDDLSATNLIRLSKLTDPQWFIINLFYCYVINQIAWEYQEKDLDANHLLNKEYEILLARAREESMETIQNLREQVEDHRQKIEQLQSTIRWKNDREKETDQLVAGRTDNLNVQIRILEKKLRKMQDVLLEKDALIEEQKAQLTDYEEMLKYKEDEVQAENAGCSLDELKKQVILFVGGHEDLLTELRKELPLCKFLSKSTEPMPDMSKIDRVVVFYKFANHTTFNKIMASVRKIQIPVQYIDRKNYSQVLEQLRRNTIS